MAFWGVEVKPGKPITHYCEKARGRLRISQATLGLGQASKEAVVVQCNVGNRRPVFVCALQPYRTLSCQLDLEFEEADDVVFSVIGPRSVYLTGYYVHRNQQRNPHSDTESYGVDIENTQTDGSSYHSDDDLYEDSFIDDDDKIKLYPHSPVLSSKGMDETTLGNDKPKERKGRGIRLKKKCQIIESDNDANSHEGGSLSEFKSERVGKTTTSDAGEKIVQATEDMDDEAKDDSVHANESKQKPDPLDINGKLDREKEPSLGEDKTGMILEKNVLSKEVETLEKILVSSQDMVHGNSKEDSSINPNLPGSDGKDQLQSLYLDKPNELPKEVETLQEIIVPIQDASQGNSTEDTRNNQNLPVSDGKDQLQSLDLTKPKKKRKIRSVKKGKTSKVQADKDHSVFGEDKEHEVEAYTNLEIGENCLVTSPELGSINGQKSKKRRKELQLEASLTEGAEEKCLNIPEGDLWEQVLLVADIMTKDLPASNGEYEDQQSFQEKNSMEGLGTECHKAPRKDEVMQERHPDSTTEELPAANGESLAHQITKENEVMLEQHANSTTEELPVANGESLEQQINKNISIKSELPVNDNQHEKIKKKKKKTQGERNLDLVATKMTDDQESTPEKNEDQGAKTVPLQKTLSNGLIIEELVSGPRTGKVAVTGKQVKIFYTAMLKESGHVYDSNVGETAFKYRLGDESYIDGWNVGIHGMRVGDKRRLIIPPSMGYGETAVENVPPNSWLIYDVELVGVRK